MNFPKIPGKNKATTDRVVGGCCAKNKQRVKSKV
jgi:hypothetical protein